jgi:nucleoside-diphosphate-sugar epimerase
MKLIIIGKNSNLSERLAVLIPGALTISARDFKMSQSLPVSIQEEVILVINAFQPAVRLREVSQPVDYIQATIMILAQVLHCLPQIRVKKLIYTSSASVYGDSVMCREEDRTNGSGLHASLKIACENLVRAFCEKFGVDYTVIRVFNMFGGGDQFSIISKIIASARSGKVIELVNNGAAVRDFIHVEDVARCFERLMLVPGLPLVNVASGKGTSVKSLLDCLTAQGVRIESRSVLRDDEIRASIANVDRLSSFVDVSKFQRPADFIIKSVSP